MAKNENRNYVTMKCTICGSELRPTSKNKKNNPDRLELKKYCPKCQKKVVAKEKK
jgi:large subunit ribosomal protein L33